MLLFRYWLNKFALFQQMKQLISMIRSSYVVLIYDWWFPSLSRCNIHDGGVELLVKLLHNIGIIL